MKMLVSGRACLSCSPSVKSGQPTPEDRDVVRLGRMLFVTHGALLSRIAPCSRRRRTARSGTDLIPAVDAPGELNPASTFPRASPAGFRPAGLPVPPLLVKVGPQHNRKGGPFFVALLSGSHSEHAARAGTPLVKVCGIVEPVEIDTLAAHGWTSSASGWPCREVRTICRSITGGRLRSRAAESHGGPAPVLVTFAKDAEVLRERARVRAGPMGAAARLPDARGRAQGEGTRGGRGRNAGDQGPAREGRRVRRGIADRFLREGRSRCVPVRRGHRGRPRRQHRPGARSRRWSTPLRRPS